MSKQRVIADLEGYDMQLMPRGLDELNEAYGNVNGLAVGNIGREIEGFRRIGRPLTSDGYDWFWSLEFERGQGKVAVLFPWCRDRDMRDGLQLDRSISVYAQGNINTADVNDLVGELYGGLQERAQKAEAVAAVPPQPNP